MRASYPSSVFRGSASAPEPIFSEHLAAVRGRVRKLSIENRWAIAGLLLAQVMVVVLYLVLIDNVAQVQNKRLAEELRAREHHRCAMMQGRLERDQCLVALQSPSPSQGIEPSTVVAQR